MPPPPPTLHTPPRKKEKNERKRNQKKGKKTHTTQPPLPSLPPPFLWIYLHRSRTYRLSPSFLARLKHQTYPEEGVQVREQIRQAAEEGRWVQLQESAEDCQEEGVRARGWQGCGKYSRARLKEKEKTPVSSRVLGWLFFFFFKGKERMIFIHSFYGYLSLVFCFSPSF